MVFLRINNDIILKSILPFGMSGIIIATTTISKIILLIIIIAVIKLTSFTNIHGGRLKTH